MCDPPLPGALKVRILRVFQRISHTATAGAMAALIDWSPRLGYDDAVP
jgi:hypothetical protein